MAHPHEKQIKEHRHAKHHALGVRGEHPDEKAMRLCGEAEQHERDKVKPEHFPNPENLKGEI
jgi:hypothetical protein